MSWRSATFAVWGLLAAAAIGLWALSVLARAAQRPVGRPGVLLRRLMANAYARSAVLLGWMWLGWHFFAR